MPIASTTSISKSTEQSVLTAWDVLPDTGSATLRLDSSVSFHQSIGLAAHPHSYALHNDVMVTSALLLCAFGMIYCAVSAKGFFVSRLKDFFHVRQRENLFAEHADGEMRGHWLLVVFISIELGVLYFVCGENAGFIEEKYPRVLLALCVGYCALGYIVKYCLAEWVNRTFFNAKSAELWAESYRLLAFLFSLMLLPVTFFTVYNGCDYEITRKCVIFLLALTELLLFYRSYRIFFGNLTGLLHLFLYLCALEIMPLFILWHGMVRASIGLTTFIS